MNSRETRILLVTAVAVLALALPGCRIKVEDGGSGKNEKVDIRTPLGQLKVDTDVDVRETGLRVYPGAMPYREQDSNDRHAANVNISTGVFGVRVIVKEFRSDDSLDKIREFYRAELKHYGTVLECAGVYDENINDHKAGDSDGNSPVSCDDKGRVAGALQLKVGTQRRQHVVGLRPDGQGTRIALVYVNVRTRDDTI